MNIWTCPVDSIFNFCILYYLVYPKIMGICWFNNDFPSLLHLKSPMAPTYNLLLLYYQPSKNESQKGMKGSPQQIFVQTVSASRLAFIGFPQFFCSRDGIIEERRSITLITHMHWNPLNPIAHEWGLLGPQTHEIISIF